MTGGAGIGGHSLSVSRLASSAQRGYEFAPGAGSIQISYGTGDPKTVTIAVEADDTLQQVADAINAKGAGPVVAAIVKNDLGEERLVLSSRKTGSDSDFTVSGGSILSEDGAYATPDLTKLNALYALDGGVEQSSKSNVLENLLPGLRVTLKGVTAAPATVSVTEPTLDRAAVKGKIKAFVDAYNGLIDTSEAKLKEKAIASPASDYQAGLGQLYGDVGLRSMLSSLRGEMTKIVDDAGINDLADLGITVPRSTGSSLGRRQGRQARARRRQADRGPRVRLAGRQQLLHRFLHEGRHVREGPDGRLGHHRRAAQERDAQPRSSQGPGRQDQRAP